MCEIGLVKSEIGYMLRHMCSFAKEHRVHTRLSRSFVKPCTYGNVLIMSPWNYPVLLALEPLTDALAAGNLRPVHLILEYKSLEEAADKINSMDSPLALYIFSSTKRTSALLKTAYNSAKAASTTLLYTSQQAKWALAR